MLITPKNWRDFQHYKDRNPPWIRLHRSLLDNKDFHRLPVASRALAPMLWLLASESVGGVINADIDDLAFRLRSSERDISLALKPLIEKGFFVVEQAASDALADRAQPAEPETEALQSTEASSETETEASQVSPGVADAPPAAKVKRMPAEKAPTVATWGAYSQAYAERYGASPVRNASVNGQIALFVGKLGAEEAPGVAAFYLSHKNGLYVSAMHPVNLMLRDAERLRTEWATGRQVTRSQGQQADKTQTNLNAFAPLIAEARAKEAEDAQRSAA